MAQTINKNQADPHCLVKQNKLTNRHWGLGVPPSVIPIDDQVCQSLKSNNADDLWFRTSKGPGHPRIAARLQCPNRASISLHLIDDSRLNHVAKNQPRMNQIKEKGPHTNSHLEWSAQWAWEQYLSLRYCDPDPSSNRVHGIVNHSCGIAKIDQGLGYCLKGTRLYRSHEVSRRVIRCQSLT